MSAEWLVAALAAAAAAAGVYWGLRFGRLLPLEVALRDERRRTRELGVFFRELFDAQGSPEAPQMLAESLRYGTDRFLHRFGGLHLFAWKRMALGGEFSVEKPDLVFRTGFLSALEPSDLELTEDIWEKMHRTQETVVWRGDIPEPLKSRFGACGLRALRLTPWGTSGRIWGLIGALDPDMAGTTLSESGVALDLLAAYCSQAAARSALYWEQQTKREQLEGGLSQTMQRLDETNLQLIRKAKEMKTLQEVTDAISERPDQSDVLGAIATTIAKALEVDVVAFLLLDDTSGELVTQPGAYGLTDDEGALYRISLKNEMSSSVRVFRAGQPFITGDAQNDPRVISHYARLWECHSLAVVPLKIESRRIGVMRVGCFRKNYFNEGHLQMLGVIAEEAAVLVESAMMTKRLAEMNRQLAHLHRLKDEFVSTVSHEFKTPLTTISGFLTVLLADEAGPLTADQRKFLGSCKRASDRLTMLVTSLLDLSKLEGGLKMDFVPVDILDVARQSVESHRWEADKRGVSLELRLQARLPWAHGDPKWLAQVFDNLISNALKFSLHGGSVAVSVENKGECLKACIQDTGLGIAQDEGQKIFEKFYRGKNPDHAKVPGTGLGWPSAGPSSTSTRGRSGSNRSRARARSSILSCRSPKTQRRRKAMRTHSRAVVALAIAAAAAVGCSTGSFVKGGKVIEDITQSMVTRTYIQSIGIGASDPALPTDTQRKSLARDAAIVKAQYEMLAMVKGVQIEGGITVSQALEKDSTLEAKVKDSIKGAEIKRSEFTKDGGCVVTLRLPKNRLEQMMGVKFK